MNKKTGAWEHYEEKEISLYELLRKVLMGWRLIIVLAVVFAVILGGFKFIKNKQAADLLQEQGDRTLEELEGSLTNAEKTALEEAVLKCKEIKEKEKYKEESVRMNIDPYAKHVITLQYYVKSDYRVNLSEEIPMDYADELVGTYVSYVENQGMQNELKQALQWDVKEIYYDELMTARGYVEYDASKTDALSNFSHIFSVTIVGKDAEQTSELADQVEGLLEKYQSVLNEKIGTHTLTLIDRYTTVQMDASLEKEQTTLNDSITTMQKEYDTLVDSFTAVQKRLLEAEVGGVEETEEEPQVSLISLKYILLGAVGGILLACVWIVLRYMLDGRIKSVKELQEMYGLQVLGKLTLEKKKKPFMSGVDRWIESFWNKEEWTLEEQKSLILANLKVNCKKEAIGKIFLTTSVHLPETDRELMKEIVRELENCGIQVVLGEDIIHNAKSFENMVEIRQVVLLEKVEGSFYEKVKNELNLCARQKVNVLGVIGIE